MKPLTAKQRRFVEEYTIDFNATRAYMAVYPGIKRTSAEVMAHRLLRNVKVGKAIQEIKDKLTEKTMITKEELIQDLVDIKSSTKIEKPDTSVRAIAQASKMLGFDAPIQKQDIPLYDFSKLTDSELEQFQKLTDKITN